VLVVSFKLGQNGYMSRESAHEILIDGFFSNENYFNTYNEIYLVFSVKVIDK